MTGIRGAKMRSRKNKSRKENRWQIINTRTQKNLTFHLLSDLYMR